MSLKAKIAAQKAKKAAKQAAKAVASGSGTAAITPSAPYSAEVQTVLSRLPHPMEPVFLPFTQVDPGYTAAGCHLWVKHRVANHGGKRVHGWVIWEYGGFAQAEFHSVWEDNGDLFNITPHRWGQKEIMFVPDPSLSIKWVDGKNLVPADISSDPIAIYRMSGQEIAETQYFNDTSKLTKHFEALGFSDTSLAD